jgi:ankyrin repeat protein
LEGDTALHVCESAECAAALVEAGADFAAVNSEGKTAFEVAVEEYREEMVAYLADLYKARGLELPAVSLPAEMSAEMFEAMGEADAEDGAGGEEESKD